MTGLLDRLAALPTIAPGDHSLTRFAPYVMVPPDALAALIEVAKAAQSLHARVEMDEAVGICLSWRGESLQLGDALARLEASE